MCSYFREQFFWALKFFLPRFGAGMEAMNHGGNKRCSNGMLNCNRLKVSLRLQDKIWTFIPKAKRKPGSTWKILHQRGEVAKICGVVWLHLDVFPLFCSLWSEKFGDLPLFFRIATSLLYPKFTGKKWCERIPRRWLCTWQYITTLNKSAIVKWKITSGIPGGYRLVST